MCRYVNNSYLIKYISSAFGISKQTAGFIPFLLFSGIIILLKMLICQKNICSIIISYTQDNLVCISQELQNLVLERSSTSFIGVETVRACVDSRQPRAGTLSA